MAAVEKCSATPWNSTLARNARKRLFRPISPRRVMHLICLLVSAAQSAYTLLPALKPDFFMTCKFSQIFLVWMSAGSLSRNFQPVHQIRIMTLDASLVKKPSVLIFKTRISGIITSMFSALRSSLVCLWKCMLSRHIVSDNLWPKKTRRNYLINS